MRLTLASRLFLLLFLSVVVNISLLLGHTAPGVVPGATPAGEVPEQERVVVSEGTRAGVAPERVAARAGNSRAYRFTTPGVRWEPCTVIGWRFNPRGGYAGSLRDAKRAFQLVARASGLRFRFEGTTSKRVARDHPDDAATEILVSWETPRTVPQLRRNVLGLAFTSYYSSTKRYVAGRIALDRTESRIRRGFHSSGPADWGQVLTHEIGHVIGLAHVRERVQNMYGTVSSRNHRLGAGDVAGMRRLGPGSSCS